MQRNSANKKTGNVFENKFEKYYLENELIYRKEQEVDAAVRKLKEKYDNYHQFIEFIEYLGATEKLFARAQVKGWDNERIKEEFIRFDITLVSQHSNVDKGVFIAIFNDFKDFEDDAHTIYEVAKQLLEKYSDENIQNFIQYLRNVFLEYIESTSRQDTPEELRSRMIRVQMDMIASKSNVDVSQLQDIYEEFKSSL